MNTKILLERNNRGITSYSTLLIMSWATKHPYDAPEISAASGDATFTSVASTPSSPMKRCTECCRQRATKRGRDFRCFAVLYPLFLRSRCFLFVSRLLLERTACCFVFGNPQTSSPALADETTLSGSKWGGYVSTGVQ